VARENKTRFALLGLLSDASLTGYEMREIIAEPVFYFWHETDASIYPTLKLLLKEKLVVNKTLFVGKRKKMVYTITEAGKKEFRRWYLEPFEPDRRRSEFFLKLFLASKKEELRTLLERRLRVYQDLIEDFRRTEAIFRKKHSDRPFCLLLIENGLAHFELEIAWVSKQLSKL